MKIVVGFESENRIEVFHFEGGPAADGSIVGTLGAEKTGVRLRPVRVKNPDFDLRMRIAAGSELYNAVERC